MHHMYHMGNIMHDIVYNHASYASYGQYHACIVYNHASYACVCVCVCGGTFLSLKLTFLSINLTFLSLNLTFLSLNLTFLSLNLTFLSLNLTFLSINLTFLSINLTFLSIKQSRDLNSATRACRCIVHVLRNHALSVQNRSDWSGLACPPARSDALSSPGVEFHV
jgi:hypothetical protein